MIEDLRAACANRTIPHAALIDEGPSASYHGIPAPAEPGTIALALGDLLFVMAEKDIRRVEKAGELYRVWLGADANVIVRLEKVIKAGEGCGCDESARGAESAAVGAMAPVWELCIPRTVCFPLANGRQVCFKILVCSYWPSPDPSGPFVAI